MLYRVLKKLSLGDDKEIKIGGFTKLEWLTEAQVSRLMAVGAVSDVAPPPLSEIPGWQGRAKKLTVLGIEDAVQLLEEEPHILAPKLKVRPATIVRWQAEVRRWLTVEPRRG